MNLALRKSGNTCIVDIGGEVDLRGSPALRKLLFQALTESPRVVINLSEIRYMDSSGIAVMIEALKNSQKLNREFAMFGLNARVREVFKLTRVLPLFKVFETEAEALGTENSHAGQE
ncbi:MAG TPA: STAS domain-containing protein [Bryobacteraceae bacterium]|jgi:anti-sigma B factor antagonist|nr:STAS domain-containing protein [Bryobacteraceae bacterium]